MCQHLPRKIRDIAYMHFWAQENVLSDWLRVWYPALLSGHTTHAPYDQLCTTIRSLDAQVATELVQWYYENHGEDLGIGQSIDRPSWYPGSSRAGSKCLLEALELQDLAKFMFMDVFGAGIAPKDCKLRALTVRIDLSDYMHKTQSVQVDKLLAPIRRQYRSAGFELRVNVVGWWADNFSIVFIADLAAELGEAFQKLAQVGVKASVQVMLSHGSMVETMYGVEDLLGANQGVWEQYLDAQLGKAS